MPTSRAASAVQVPDRMAAAEPPHQPQPGSTPALLKIQEVAAETGATARAVRYYEEVGLLRPAARSDGDYRLYDASDVERIRHIRELRDVAGFSLAEIGQLLEDEEARASNRVVFRATEDPAVRRRVLVDSIGRIERSVGVLQAKMDRLAAMVLEAEARRDRLRARLDDLSAETATPATADPQAGR